jgi:hypothetical protein
MLACALFLGLSWASPDAADELVLLEGEIPIQLINRAQETADQPLWKRMRAVSTPLKGTPYQVDAAGEGWGPDPDPPVRYDAFDCLTFVEEILALTIPADPVSAPLVRNALRYGPSGEISYENRNHFMLHQWIPNNIKGGMLVDITTELGQTVEMRKSVTINTWRHWKSRAKFSLSDEQLPTGSYALDVLPLDVALEQVAKFPPGALVITVRENRSYVPIVVTHIGFVIPSDDPERPLLRHATKMGSEPRVRDDFLDWYVEHLANYRYWKVAGVVVLMPQETTPRIVSESR